MPDTRPTIRLILQCNRCGLEWIKKADDFCPACNLRERIAQEIEEYRLALPIDTPAYGDGTRSRDDMSWALAQVRDRIARGGA